MEKKHVDYCYSFNADKEEIENAEKLSVSTLIINEANLSKIEKSRLDHWRMAHRTSTGARFTDQCQCCEMATVGQMSRALMLAAPKMEITL